jgi:hypothetical protein
MSPAYAANISFWWGMTSGNFRRVRSGSNPIGADGADDEDFFFLNDMSSSSSANLRWRIISDGYPPETKYRLFDEFPGAGGAP